MLKAERKNGSASCSFEVRQSKDHFGYVHRSGFAITVSEARPHENAMVHFLKAEIDPDATESLGHFPDLWAFLENCTPDATVSDEKLQLPVSRSSWLSQCGFPQWPPKTGHLCRMCSDVDSTGDFSLQRHEQCLEQRKETGMYGPPLCRKRKTKVTGWSAQMYSAFVGA
jgi:hypothetical protein